MEAQKIEDAFNEADHTLRKFQLEAFNAELVCRADRSLRGVLDNWYSSAHCRWICAEGRTLVIAGELEKAMRWLGFMQGVLWVLGISSIDDLRKTNAPEGSEFVK